MNNLFQGFKNFITRGNSVDLAVGVVIGAAFNTMIQAIVKDFITPLIGVLIRTKDFANNSFDVAGSKFMYGDLINAILSFFLIAVVVYFFVILPMNAVMSKVRKPRLPSTKVCPECLSEIPISARRCSYCTQLVK